MRRLSNRGSCLTYWNTTQRNWVWPISANLMNFALGTAHAPYGLAPTVFDGLIQECKTNYLLADVPPPASPGTTLLPHDTLAPVVRLEFDRSLKDGQRPDAYWKTGRRNGKTVRRDTRSNA